MTESTKENHSHRSIDKQLDFLILLTLHDGEDMGYLEYGVKLNNLTANLAENKQLWLVADKENPDGKWEETLDWHLSILHREGFLGKKDVQRHFYWIPNSLNKLKELVKDLTIQLELDIELGELVFEKDLKPEHIVGLIGVEENFIPYELLSESLDDQKVSRRRLILTTEQGVRLAQFSIEHGFYEY